MLRTAFHEQLAVLWHQHRQLDGSVPLSFQKPSGKKGDFYTVPETTAGQHGLLWRLPCGGRNLIPLINHAHGLHCHVDLRLHRPLRPGSILYSGGDLDNRLKVIFDAMSMPKSATEVTHGTPGDNEDQWDAFFCLLEDDKLITKVSIESFALLKAAPDGDENYIEFDADIQVEPIAPTIKNLGWLFR